MIKYYLITDKEKIEFESSESRASFILEKSPSNYTLSESQEEEILDLTCLKETKILAIDAKTQEIISRGFSFDGQLFSLSIPAQSNWTNIKANKETFNNLGQFPLTVSTKTSTLYQLAYEDVESFWAAGMLAVKSAYNSGGELKAQVVAAATVDDLNAIVDSRE